MINLKELNTFIPYKNFKTAGLHPLMEILEQDDYLCMLDLKDAYFCVPLKKKSRKNVFRMGEFSVRIPMSVFWPRSSPKVDTRESFGGNNLKQGLCDLPVTESRICYKLKEISSSPNIENRYLGNYNRLSGDGSVPGSEKVESISKICQDVSIKDLAKLLGTLS